MAFFRERPGIEANESWSASDNKYTIAQKNPLIKTIRTVGVETTSSDVHLRGLMGIKNRDQTLLTAISVPADSVEAGRAAVADMLPQVSLLRQELTVTSEELILTETKPQIDINLTERFREHDISTQTGEVSAVNLPGNLRVRTLTGDVQVEDHSEGSVSIGTNVGDVKIVNYGSKRRSIHEGLNIATEKGNVTVDGMSGPLRASTTEGNVTVFNAMIDGSQRPKIKTETGDIDVELVDPNMLVQATTKGEIMMPEQDFRLLQDLNVPMESGEKGFYRSVLGYFGEPTDTYNQVIFASESGRISFRKKPSQ